MLRTVLIISLALSACRGGGITTATPNPTTDESVATPWGNVEITKDAFLFGSSFPADLVIPDIDGMRDTAFVASTLNPSGVLAIDLTAQPFQLSKSFKGLIAPSGTGIPSSLAVLSPTQAFLLTSSHLIYFNPTSGSVVASVSAIQDISFPFPPPLSEPFDVDGNGDLEVMIDHITPSYPANIAIHGAKVYVSSANLIHPVAPAVAAPGTVQIFSFDASTVKREGYLFTTDYNPTGLVLWKGHLVVVNSGVSDVQNGASIPKTTASVDLIDLKTEKMIANLKIGAVAAAFTNPSLSLDGRLFLPSASYGEIYAVDLAAKAVLHNHANPIIVTGNTIGADFLPTSALSIDDRFLFVGSFEESAVYPIDINAADPIPLPAEFPEPFPIGLAKGVNPKNPTGAPTGVGSIVTRPGIPDIDYSGPDLFVTTGSPGSLVAINTRGTGENPKLPIASFIITPNPLTLSAAPVQASAAITFENGKTIATTQTFTNPFSGYPLQIGWKCGDPGIATVSATGLVKGVANGTTTLTAQIGNYSAAAAVTVSGVAASGSQLPPAESMGITADPPSGGDPFADKVVSYKIGTDGGHGQDYLPENVLGPPNGFGNSGGNDNPFDVVSLGCDGEIVLEMTDYWIADGDGVDFIVFENAFFVQGNVIFAERGVVGVSQDGIHFVEFPCAPTIPPFEGCAGVNPVLSSPENGIDPTDPAQAGGDAFDLAEVGVATARFVRIRAVSCQGAAPKAGFDLDAMSVVWGILPN